MRLAGLAILLCIGCIDTDLVPCGKDQLCPSGRTCVLLADPEQTVCASSDEIAACVGVADGERCSLGGSDSFVCRGRACLPITCGNQRVDPGESCDDGNTVTGDGTCSADCLSDETCGNGVVDPLVVVSGVKVPNEQCDDGNLASSDRCSSTCRVETPRWIQLDGAPPALKCGAMTYDAAHRRTVLFGGLVLDAASTERPTNGMFEWTGTGWKKLASVIVPQARMNHALAYDAARHRVVLFGGHIGNPGYPLAETWEWDGTTWSQRATTGPAARSSHTMVYDAARKKVMLFGGYAVDGTRSDTWEWDGSTWTQLATTNDPPPAPSSPRCSIPGSSRVPPGPSAPRPRLTSSIMPP